MMSATTSMSSKTGAVNTPDEGAALAALRKLPPDCRADVLRYIEFLDYKINSAGGEAAEKATLWSAVEANRTYKRLHPDEDLEVYETGDDLLEAFKNM